MKNGKDSYKNTVSRDGTISPKLFNPVADRIRNYCKRQNVGIAKFVEDCMNAQLDILEREEYNSMPREMLIELLVSKKN